MAGDAVDLPANADATWRLRLEAGPGSKDPDAIRAWARSVAAEGRRRPGTELGGDLLSGAASTMESSRLDAREARAYALEAVAVYPPGHPGVGFARFEQAVLESRLGDAAAALAALDEAGRLSSLPDRRDAPPDEVERRAVLRRQMSSLGAAWRTDLLTTLERHEEVAVFEEDAAEARRGGPGADLAWQRAAAAAWRAKDRERALADIARAIDVVGEDGRRVDLVQWRLLATHGLLDARGDVALTSTWPGPAFLEEARTALRGLQGRRGAYKLAVQVAALAWSSGRPAEALEMYEAAFRDPDFEGEARKSAFARQRLVTAAWIALRAGNPAKARAWLQRAAMLAGAPIPGTEGLSLQIDEALARQDQDPPPSDSLDAETAVDGPRGPKVHPGLDTPESASAVDAGRPPSPAEVEPIPRRARWILAICCGLAATLVTLALVARKRSVRRAEAHGPGGRDPRRLPEDRDRL